MNFEKTLRQTVDDYGLMAKKALGQNFLLNQNITDKIIKLSLEKQGLTDFSEKDVLEVGPGPGGLTRAIIKQNPRHLTVVEMDERCIEIMNELKNQTDVLMDVLNQDALALDISNIASKPLQIVSNLPYNISVPLLTSWLENIHCIEAMTLMFQKEVADRICAPVKTKDYGRLSVIAQLTCRIERLLTLNPDCFVPAPKIFSTVLLFLPLEDAPHLEILHKVSELTKLAFAQRRKMVRQSLKSVPNLEKVLDLAGVLPTMRAEEINPEQYLKMAELL